MKNAILIALTLAFFVTSHAQNKPKFEVKINPEMELLSIVLNYSYWDYFGKFKTTEYEYYNNMKAHFDKYKNHSTIQWFDDISKNWNADDPSTVIQWYEGIPLKQKVPFPLHASSQIDTVTVKIFIEKLNLFAEETKFWQFWEDNKNVYKKMQNKIDHLLPYDTYIKKLEQFYGEYDKQFVFILAPLFNGYGFGPQVINNRQKTAYFITGFSKMDKGKPYFSDDDLRMLIFHEFGHSFVNPICEEYRTELYKYEYLSEYIKSSFLSNYTGWFAFCHEHIVRAGEGILLEKAGFKKEAEENYKKNMRLGFTLLPFFKEKLEYYDSHRNKYTSFKDYFPEMLKVFEEVEQVKSKRPKPIGLYFKASNEKVGFEFISESSPYRDIFQLNDSIISVNNIAMKSQDDIFVLKDMFYESSESNILKFKILRDGEVIEKSLAISFEDCYSFIKK